MEISLLGKRRHIPLNGLNVSRRLEFSLLQRYLAPNQGELVLDIACGDGYWTSKLSQTHCQIIGFDLNRDRLRQAKATLNSGGSFVCSDAHILPFADAVFDKAIGVCVLEHFFDDRKALVELHRVLKPGGQLALTVDSFSHPSIKACEKEAHAVKYAVVQFYTKTQLESLLGDSGFEVLQWRYLLNTSPSAWLYRCSLKHPKLAYLIFPFSYLISLCSEHWTKTKSGGYKLAVLARAL
ncbi:MAG: class I SAM-dependent methyltransferase [bacterium]